MNGSRKCFQGKNVVGLREGEREEKIKYREEKLKPVGKSDEI